MTLNPLRAWWAARQMDQRRRRLLRLAGKAIVTKAGEPRIDVLAKHGFVWILLSTDEQRHAVPLHPDTAGDVINAVRQSIKLARGQRGRRADA